MDLDRTGVLKAGFSAVSERAKKFVEERRPMADFLDKSQFAKPESVTEAGSRLRKNLAYFKVRAHDAHANGLVPVRCCY
eukprot:scaffold306_cov525-Prasinococcus_capsulatus_cf.AAC.37